MAWFKVDDKFHSHTKVMQCSDAAIGVWTKLGSWCGEQLNGGRVTRASLKHFRVKTKLAAELVAAGLWIRVGDEFQFHDWEDHQPSKDQVLAQRQATKERVSRHRVGKSNAVTATPCNAVTNAVSNAAPVPTRPDPIPEEELRSPPTRAREGSDFSVGSDLMLNATGRFYGAEWRPQLCRIGMKPELERRAVLAAIQADPWCKSNLAVDPGHVLKQWPKYAAGNPPLKSVVRATAPPRLAMGPVSSAEEHAADAANKDWEWPTFSNKP